MIEQGRRPVRGRVALLAGLREPAAHVRRVRGALEGCQVTAHALRSRSCEIGTGVALRALHCGMRASKRKCGFVVIKRGVEPAARVMTRLTGLREPTRDVVGIGCALEVG